MKKLLIALIVLSIYAPAHAFRDVQPNSTLRPAIDFFIDKGVLEGEGFFRGEDTMPATWFWEIILGAAGFDPSSATFQTPVPAGVDPDSKEGQYLREAIRRGFIDVDENFDAFRPIRRLEAIELIVKTKGILPPKQASTKFKNLVSGVSPFARYLDSVEAAYASGILTKADLDPLKPLETLKRKELIRWLHNWHENGEKKVSGLTKSPISEIQLPHQKRLQEGSSNTGGRVSVGPVSKVNDRGSVKRDLAVLEEILNQIEAKYRFQEELTLENRKELINHGIEAIVEKLDDKYSSYVRPDKKDDFLDSLTGQFEGIGAYVELLDNKFSIRAPIKGSPAESAGLEPGDIVLEVDGEDIAGQTINEIIKKVKGPAGTTVKLKIQRVSRPPFDVDVTRGKIVVPDITVEFKNGIPVVNVSQFKRDTGTRLEQVLRTEVLPKNPRGIVFDLRNNPGGFLTAAVDVGKIFLEANQVVFSTDYRDQPDRIYDSEEAGLLADFDNMVFLQNGGSASATEILHGMIQDHKIGKIIGQKSVGKGTVQEVLQFLNGGSLKLTVAKWLTPNGRWINETGVIPDIEVTNPTEEERLKKVDRQLDRAIQEVLQG